MLNFERLQVPQGDGEILIEPAPAEWPLLLEANRQLTDDNQCKPAGRPIHEWRSGLRARLGIPSGTPIIACGHQPAFIHPGVWIKQIAARTIAQHEGTFGIDFVVDNDTPATPAITIPAIDHQAPPSMPTVPISTARILAMRDLPIIPEFVAGSAYEGLPAPDIRRLEDARKTTMETLAELYGNSLIDEYYKGMIEKLTEKPSVKRTTGSQPGDFVAIHLGGRAKVDVGLNAYLPHVRVSDLFGGPFMADLLLNADEFANNYNAALVRYRADHGVRNTSRPLPDLAEDGERTEIAFWIYRHGRRRQRSWISRHGDQLRLWADQSLVASVSEKTLRQDPETALANLAGWCIRPRALTLTLWLRMLACDLFIHGIGGAKYDRITDDIIRHYYRREPPAYACVSATLRLPLPDQSDSARILADAIHEARDLLYNPQRYIPGLPTELITTRNQLIHEALRLREMERHAAKRREIFLAIRDLNRQLLDHSPGLPDRFAQRIDIGQRQVRSHDIAQNRDFFYALQPRERLIQLADNLRHAFDT